MIQGSAINNDGSAQGRLHRAERRRPGRGDRRGAGGGRRRRPRRIGYVEAHGTGTPLGDPIEVAALTQAFRARTGAPRLLRASARSRRNIGHLDAAAGVAGLIKTVLALRAPASSRRACTSSAPNPQIDFASSPFYVNAALRDVAARTATPRRAGVSSFGIGGTNAHVVAGGGAAAPAPAAASRPWQLLVLSAQHAPRRWTRRPRSLRRAPGRRTRTLTLADVAYTLQVGRAALRAPARAWSAATATDARGALASPRSGAVRRRRVRGAASAPVAFLFPGQGAQYAGMGARAVRARAGLPRRRSTAAPSCCGRSSGCDLRERALSRRRASEAAAASAARRPRSTQPALFAVEYALARLWMSWGVRPQAMIGHSIGEYVAACLAGVLLAGGRAARWWPRAAG